MARITEAVERLVAIQKQVYPKTQKTFRGALAQSSGIHWTNQVQLNRIEHTAVGIAKFYYRVTMRLRVGKPTTQPPDGLELELYDVLEDLVLYILRHPDLTSEDYTEAMLYLDEEGVGIVPPAEPYLFGQDMTEADLGLRIEVEIPIFVHLFS
jgi:hypothetical protein